jgi:putative Holliday junction resolvase
VTRGTLLGVDLGSRRIGVAIADQGIGARPLTTLNRGRTLELDVEALGRLVQQHHAVELVVGLPLDMSGTEGEQATETRAWAEGVAAALAIPLALRDERLSSHVAESRVGAPKRGASGGPPGRTRRDANRARIDREAATIILQDELDARAGLNR